MDKEQVTEMIKNDIFSQSVSSEYMSLNSMGSFIRSY